MKKICIIYPRITAYILPLLKGLASEYLLDVIYSSDSIELGFGEHDLFSHPNINWIELKTIYPFREIFGMYQSGLTKYIFSNRPDAIITFANPRYISFWLVLFMGKILKIDVYSRGHGLIKKEHPNIFQKISFWVICKLSTKYICYTESVKDSLHGLARQKSLVVDYNTLYNDYPVKPNEKTGKENGILFIGRLRTRCGIDILIDALNIIREEQRADIQLHVIGDGPQSKYVESKLENYRWINYYGAIFNDEKISEISRQCRFGCYPGEIGLSVVHMFSFSLPLITHDCFYIHGPEASYVKDGKNGFFYTPILNTNSLVATINKMLQLPIDQITNMQKEAFQTYQELSTPPFHVRVMNIIDNKSVELL